MKAPKIPKDFPVQPLKPTDKAVQRTTCGSCGLSWDDGVSTQMTPTPSARCPFEYFHNEKSSMKTSSAKKSAKSSMKTSSAKKSAKKTNKTDWPDVKRLRKAIMSAATLLQGVPEGEMPDEDTLDFIDTDVRTALSAIADIQNYRADDGEESSF